MAMCLAQPDVAPRDRVGEEREKHEVGAGQVLRALYGELGGGVAEFVARGRLEQEIRVPPPTAGTGAPAVAGSRSRSAVAASATADLIVSMSGLTVIP